jgi:hypothetical protein
MTTVEVFAPYRGTFIEVLMGGAGAGGGFIIPPDVARKSLPNVFLKENQFNGFRLTPKIITSDYTIVATDCLICADASAGPIAITLSPAFGSGQELLIIKTDSSNNPVTIYPDGTDLIDSDPSIVLDDQWDWTNIYDCQVSLWANFSRLSPFNLPTNIAYQDSPNIFTEVNQFSGMRLMTRLITLDDIVDETDNVLVTLPSSGPITITLPPTQPSNPPFPRRAPWYYFKNISDLNHAVTIQVDPDSGDLIDGAISVTYTDLYADLMLFDVAPGRWSNVGPVGEGGTGTATAWGSITGTLSDQTDLQAALDSKLTIPVSPPTITALSDATLNQTWAKVNELITLLQGYDLAA